MTPAERKAEIGRRIRLLRAATGMSLDKVEAASGGRLKAVCLGSYERGQRGMTVDRLAEICDFYGADPAGVIPLSRRTRMGLDDRLALEQAAGLLAGVLRDGDTQDPGVTA